MRLNFNKLEILKLFQPNKAKFKRKITNLKTPFYNKILLLVILNFLYLINKNLFKKFIKIKYIFYRNIFK